MKEKLKTVAIIMLLIISLILIVACRNSMRSVILPGHNMDQEQTAATIADSMTSDQYPLPLTR